MSRPQLGSPPLSDEDPISCHLHVRTLARCVWLLPLASAAGASIMTIDFQAGCVAG